MKVTRTKEIDRETVADTAKQASCMLLVLSEAMSSQGSCAKGYVDAVYLLHTVMAEHTADLQDLMEGKA